MVFSHDFPGTDELPFRTDQLLTDAIAEILRHEEWQTFFAWMRRNLPRYFTSDPMRRDLPDEALTSMALSLAMVIWNAMPLPGNNYRPRPLPSPGRNTPCPCGSGRKYKRCCRTPVAPPPLEPEFLWLLLLTQLPEKEIRHLISNNMVPLAALEQQAGEYLLDGHPGKAISILEPLFSGEEIASTGEDAGLALDTLCDAYRERGFSRKKRRLVEKIIATVGKSPLRCIAWQRLALIRMDEDMDSDAAWEAFQRAISDNPDDFSNGTLEVQILLADGRDDEARMRALFWKKRLLREGYGEDHPAVVFFEDFSVDPLATQVQAEMDMCGGRGVRLMEWLRDVGDRPAPVYGLAACRDEARPPFADEGPEGVAQMTLPYGKPEAEIAKGGDGGGSEYLLEAPAAILRTEKKWSQVFVLDKPFSFGFSAFSDEDPWENEEEWTQFLHRHPEAFDSLDILDDLASALEMDPDLTTGTAFASLLEPMARRSLEIIKKSMSGHGGGVILPWMAWENRPALRNVARLILLLQECSPREAVQLAAWLLEVNPGDNHGFRGLVINDLLRRGEDEAAAALADRYPDDMLVETVLGRILALYRLQRLDEAAVAVAGAMKGFETAIRFLWRARVKKPQLHLLGVSVGGEDQAWLYREEMRDVWHQTPGALEWLRKESRRR